MSRIGKRPIAIPNKVTVEINGQHVAVKGPKGSLERVLPPQVKVEKDGETLQILRQDDSRTARERHGLSRWCDCSAPPSRLPPHGRWPCPAGAVGVAEETRLVD